MRKNFLSTLVILFMNIFLCQMALAQEQKSSVKHLTKKEFMEKIYNYECEKIYKMVSNKIITK